jgi:cytochrome P450
MKGWRTLWLTWRPVDYFSDPAIAQDPYEYLDYLRSRNPVFREPHYGVVAVTGYQEANEAFRNTDVFSACVSIGGPFPPLPFAQDHGTGRGRDQSRHRRNVVHRCGQP